MDFSQLISAAGLGGILGGLITSIIQHKLANKQQDKNRAFQEKKEAYIGLIDAYRLACLESSDINRRNINQNNFAYWAVRCELIAPENIVQLIEKMKTDKADEQDKLFKQIKQLIRKELRVA
jgi:hypothetical protein